MEFVYVKYWRHRKVFIDGVEAGMTNVVLTVGQAGFHTFTLSPPPNYVPAKQRKLVRNTSPQFPLEIEFLHQSQVPPQVPTPPGP